MLCDQFRINALGNVRDCLQTKLLHRILIAVDDEVAVDLDKVRIDAENRREIGEACSEIVNGNFHAKLADLVQEVHHFVEIADFLRFQNFKGDASACLLRQITQQFIQHGTAGFGTDVIGGQVQEHTFCAVAEQFQYLFDHQLGKL